MKKILVFSIISLYVLACKSDNNSSAKEQARQSIQSQTTNPTPLPNAAPATTSTGIAGVQHYICPNNCEGSGGAAQGSCPVCGTAYVHNQAFHSQPAGNTATTANPATSTGQNAAGEYHYICSNGCAGGSGSQGNCATCGNPLVHNQAYHN